jgi:hypothetical protein
MKTRKLIAGAALLAGVSAAAQAAQIAVESGAVGVGERERMMQEYADFNLHFAFAQTDGAYVADVAVAIRDPEGRLVWRGVSEGPFLFAQIPSGRYLVTAEYDGRTVTRRIEARSAPGPMHYFRWQAGEY